MDLMSPLPLSYKNSQGNDELEEVVGEVARITYRNPENRYSVIKINLDEGDALVVVGNCLEFSVGTQIRIRGEYSEHPKFGRQFKALQAKEVEPVTPAAIKKYLGSGLIKGIGEKTAGKIVQAFGEQALDVIRFEPERVALVPGVGSSKAKLLCEAIAKRRGRIEIEQFFIDLEAGLALTNKIYNQYEEEAIEIFKEDPYTLAKDITGVGFLTADRLAQNYGVELTSSIRIRAALLYTLEQARNDGHCCLPREELIVRCQRPEILGVLPSDSEELDFESAIDQLLSNGEIAFEHSAYYLRSLIRAEQFVSEFLTERTIPYSEPLIAKENVERSLNRTEKELDVLFSDEQKEAVQTAANYPLLVITGGPGCGKTTIIRALVKTFLMADKVLALAAPTGKAAQRMSEMCGYPSSTIHRLLKYDPFSHSFLYGPDRPLAVEDEDEKEELVEVVIIDEASMLDLPLAKSLFSSIPKNATLILVGDKDQLPPVGPGNVFESIVSIPEIQTAKLNTIYRQAEDSSITKLAHMTNSGITPNKEFFNGDTNSEVFLFQLSDPQDMANMVGELVHKKLPEKFGYEPEDITVLTPSNRGVIGTEQLNLSLQEKLNPKKSSYQTTLKSGNTEYRVGDKICQRKNNYYIHNLGVFNGDQGSVYEVDDDGMTIELWDGRLVDYTKKDILQISLSYALTIHRAQGSEMECVVLVLDRSHYALLDRRLFYTAVTRAKKHLIIVTSKSALNLAIKQTKSHKRFSFLKERVTNLLAA